MRLYIYMYEQIYLEQWLQQLLSSSRRIVRLVQHVALATQRLGIHKYAYMCIYIYVYTNKKYTSRFIYKCMHTFIPINMHV